MKKITLLFSFILIATLSFYSCEQSQIDPTDPEANDVIVPNLMKSVQNFEKARICGEQTCTLWAGSSGDNPAGEVTISNDDSHLYITTTATYGFQSGDNLYIWIEKTLPTVRPNPHNLTPYLKTKIEPGVPGKTVTYTIPYSKLGIETGDGVVCEPHKFYVMVHANVINSSGGTDTAFAGCSDIQWGHGWWYYTEYYTQCCECWCGFGNDYQSPEQEACLSMMYDNEKYIFWSNKFGFKEFYDTKYPVSLLINPTMCAPQDKKGTLVDELAMEVGIVYLTSYIEDGKPYVDITYNMFKKYKGFNIQLDLYIGADRIPKYDLDKKMIITDKMHMLYQHKLSPGETSYTFKKIPWLTKEESGDTYIALHSAIGDCPMPSLQNPM